MSTCSSGNATTGAGNVEYGGPAHSFALFLLIFFPIYVIALCAVFRHFQPYYVFLRKRSFSRVLVNCVVGGLGTLTYTAAFDYFGADAYPCWLILVLFHSLSAWAPAMLMLKLAEYNNEFTSVYLGKRLAQGRASPSSPVLAAQPVPIPAKCSWLTASTYFSLTFAGGARPTLDQRVLRLQFMKSWGFYAFTLGVLPLTIGFVAVAVQLALQPQTYASPRCFGCSLTAFDVGMQLGNSLLAICIAFVTIPSKVLRRDPLRVMREVKMGFIAYLCGTVFYVLFLVNHQDAVVNWITLTLLSVAAHVYIVTWHQVLLARSMRRSLLASQNDRQVCFDEVMADATLRDELQAYLDAELSSEILPFLDNAEEYRHRAVTADNGDNGEAVKAEYAVLTVKARSKLAKEIYKAYICVGAPREVNVSWAVRAAIVQYFEDDHQQQEGLAAAAASPPATLFDAAVAEVRGALLNDGFARYMARMRQANKAIITTTVTTTTTATQDGGTLTPQNTTA